MDDEFGGEFVRLVEPSGALVAVYDGFDRLRYANQAFRHAFFIDADEEPLWPDLMRRNFLAKRGTVISAHDFEAWLRSTVSRRGKTGFRSYETNLHDGRWLWMTETVQANGWMLCIATDVSKLRESGRSLRQARDDALKAAQTDELTGTANRRFVTARIEEMLATATGGAGAGGSVCVLDLDNFKYINDRFGHQAGDTILRNFSELIQGYLRRSDCFGRIGGEEFVLVLPRTRAREAELIVERMLAAVRLSRPLEQHPNFQYTFSAGVAEARADDTVDSLYSRADNALYSAKLAGRNRIQFQAA